MSFYFEHFPFLTGSVQAVVPWPIRRSNVSSAVIKTCFMFCAALPVIAISLY